MTSSPSEIVTNLPLTLNPVQNSSIANAINLYTCLNTIYDSGKSVYNDIRPREIMRSFIKPILSTVTMTVTALRNLIASSMKTLKLISNFLHISNNVVTLFHAIAGTLNRYTLDLIITITNGVAKFLELTTAIIAPASDKRRLIIFVVTMTIIHQVKTCILNTKVGPSSLVSAFLNKFNQRYTKATSVKNIFIRMPMSSRKEDPAHSHPIGAKGRSDAINTMQSILTTAGYNEYVIQPRPSDVQLGKQYKSQYFWGKDTRVPAHTDDITQNHAITITDTDYYMDMPSQLQNYNPHFIYTMTPTHSAATNVGNLSYTFEGSEIVTHICGGATYRHQLWDYSGEMVTIYFYGPYFIPVMQQFLIERRSVNLTHSLIALIPYNRWTGLAAITAYNVLNPTFLTRVDPRIEKFTVIRTISSDSDVVSVSIQGDYTAATIATSSLEEIKNLQRYSKVGMTQTAIKTKMDKSLSGAQITVLLSFIRDTVERNTIEFYRNYKVEYAVQTYHLFPDTYSSDVPPSLTSFMFPIISGGAFTPTKTLASAIGAIEGRVNNLKQLKLMTQQHYYLFHQFLRRLIPDDIAFTRMPEDEDYVLDKQDRPQQQRTLFEAFDQNVTKPFQSIFVKKEAYGKIADPRVITTEKPIDKLEYSKYQYTISKFLKEQDWYAFGKTPYEIAVRVAHIAVNSKTINCTDFSRMDGRKTICTRTLNYLFMKRLFSCQYHEDIHRICSAKINVHSCSPMFDGETYQFNSELAQGSGLPDTSNFNSLDNAFNNFLAYYYQTGSFDIAWSMLNNLVILGGDDTVAGDLLDENINKASTAIGHVITSDIYKVGDPGVNFLARQYGPYLWEGDTNSCTDVMRALSKLHTTVTLPPNVTPLEKLAQKLTSLYYTDAQSPIIGCLISKWLELGGNIAEKDQWRLRSYWAQYPLDVQYTNYEADWMYDLLPTDLNYTEFYDYLDSTTELSDLLKMHLILDAATPSFKQQVVLNVDGDDTLIGPDDTRVPQPQQPPDYVPPKGLDLKLSSYRPLDSLSKAFTAAHNGGEDFNLKIQTPKGGVASLLPSVSVAQIMDPNRVIKPRYVRKPFNQNFSAAKLYSVLDIVYGFVETHPEIKNPSTDSRPPGAH